MTAKFQNQQRMGLPNVNQLVINTVSLFIIGCLITLCVMAYHNPPDAKTANGIFSLWLLLGCISSFTPFVLSLLATVEKVKLNLFWVGTILFMANLYIGLYKQVTF
jgi:hypothetical protein